MRIKLSHLGGVLAFGALLGGNVANAADSWKPTKPIQIIVPRHLAAVSIWWRARCRM